VDNAGWVSVNVEWRGAQVRQYLYFCTSKASKLSRRGAQVLSRVARRPGAEFTCFTGTKVQILTQQEVRRSRARRRAWAVSRAAERERERESRSVGSARRLLGRQCCWLYWCKSANTDAEGAASLSPLRPAHELGVIDLLANFCGWLELLADMHVAPSEPGTNLQMLTQLVLKYKY